MILLSYLEIFLFRLMYDLCWFWCWEMVVFHITCVRGMTCFYFSKNVFNWLNVFEFFIMCSKRQCWNTYILIILFSFHNDFQREIKKLSRFDIIINSRNFLISIDVWSVLVLMFGNGSVPYHLWEGLNFFLFSQKCFGWVSSLKQ